MKLTRLIGRIGWGAAEIVFNAAISLAKNPSIAYAFTSKSLMWEPPAKPVPAHNHEYTRHGFCKICGSEDPTDKSFERFPFLKRFQNV